MKGFVSNTVNNEWQRDVADSLEGDHNSDTTPSFNLRKLFAEEPTYAKAPTKEVFPVTFFCRLGYIV
jgi:hypothetical protein